MVRGRPAVGIVHRVVRSGAGPVRLELDVLGTWRDVLHVDPSRWGETPIGDVMRRDAPVGRPDWTIGQALAAMLGADVDHLPVVDEGGQVVGVCTALDILDLDELLDRLDPGADGDESRH